MNQIKYMCFLFFILSLSVKGQELLVKQNAVGIALENNFDIKVSNNEKEAAKNSSNVLNSGFLPSVFASGGAGYQNNENEVEFQDGSIQDDIKTTIFSPTMRWPA